jgi:CheY-like chemotaxis protein
VLVVVDDPNLLDLLTRVFEGRRFAVATAATSRQAIASLESGRTLDVVVAAWDGAHPVGGEVYRWVLKNRVGLRAHFVFLGDDLPDDYDRLVAGRCLAVRADEVEELVRVVETTARRNERLERMTESDLTWLDTDRPPLLLVDGDPLQLMVMASLLGDVGFLVTAVESGNAAIAQLEVQDFDVVVTGWYMPDGSGADLYRWLCTMRPWLLDRIVILTGGGIADAQQIAQGVPLIPKGQESVSLLPLLAASASRTRGAA